MATLVHDTLCATLSGLSKVYRACGYRVGWAGFSGRTHAAADYLSALELLSSLRLCSNVPAQWAVQTALGGYQSIRELVAPGGRLYESRARDPRGHGAQPVPAARRRRRARMYAFVGVDTAELPDFDDQQFALDLLEQKHVLVAPGVSFNVPYRNHFRITNLPDAATLREVFARIEELLAEYARDAEAGEAAPARSCMRASSNFHRRSPQPPKLLRLPSELTEHFQRGGTLIVPTPPRVRSGAAGVRGRGSWQQRLRRVASPDVLTLRPGCAARPSARPAPRPREWPRLLSAGPRSGTCGARCAAGRRGSSSCARSRRAAPTSLRARRRQAARLGHRALGGRGGAEADAAGARRARCSPALPAAGCGERGQLLAAGCRRPRAASRLRRIRDRAAAPARS